MDWTAKMQVLITFIALIGQTFPAELVKSPSSTGLFITGRGCGASNPYNFLNFVPAKLEDFECSFINLETFAPG